MPDFSRQGVYAADGFYNMTLQTGRQPDDRISRPAYITPSELRVKVHEKGAAKNVIAAVEWRIAEA